jgi:hypothetical protein
MTPLNHRKEKSHGLAMTWVYKNKKPRAELLPVIIDLQLGFAGTLPQDTTTPPHEGVMKTIFCDVLSVITCSFSTREGYH